MSLGGKLATNLQNQQKKQISASQLREDAYVRGMVIQQDFGKLNAESGEVPASDDDGLGIWDQLMVNYLLIINC